MSGQARDSNSRDIDYATLVRKAWGKEWNKPETAYEFSNGRKFESTDAREGGPYGGDESGDE